MIVYLIGDSNLRGEVVIRLQEMHARILNPNAKRDYNGYTDENEVFNRQKRIMDKATHYVVISDYTAVARRLIAYAEERKLTPVTVL